MERIEFWSDDATSLQILAMQLGEDLKQAGIARDLQLGSPATVTEREPTRGDPITLTTVALTAVGAGGALSVLLGKDGFLTALARVLEKQVEARVAKITIETKGKKVQVTGPVGEIKAILKQLRD